ncbi:hypothetical protein RJ641_005411 [Dillenia turbinata]|uniref:Uncharacterized protein n=1 Tax=Dillenia turbinata TaxID=194707 RepID=A0AAN8Z8T0_9MAGN
MHLWPSLTIRESFKVAYLRKVQWNLNRMSSEKKRSSSSANQKLLDNNVESDSSVSNNISSGVRLFFRELIMTLSCCFCCEDRKRRPALSSRHGKATWLENVRKMLTWLLCDVVEWLTTTAERPNGGA